jgi:hypothetical protein
MGQAPLGHPPSGSWIDPAQVSEEPSATGRLCTPHLPQPRLTLWVIYKPPNAKRKRKVVEIAFPFRKECEMDTEGAFQVRSDKTSDGNTLEDCFSNPDGPITHWQSTLISKYWITANKTTSVPPN